MFKYVVVPKKSPVDASTKFYAEPDVVTPVTLDVIADRIEKRSTVSSADAKAVLDALQFEIKEAVINNGSVRLGDLGTFRATIASKGTINRGDFVASNIVKLNLRFLPSKKLQNWLNPAKNTQLSFMKAGDRFSHLGPVEEE